MANCRKRKEPELCLDVGHGLWVTLSVTCWEMGTRVHGIWRCYLSLKDHAPPFHSHVG